MVTTGDLPISEVAHPWIHEPRSLPQEAVEQVEAPDSAMPDELDNEMGAVRSVSSEVNAEDSEL